MNINTKTFLMALLVSALPSYLASQSQLKDVVETSVKSNVSATIDLTDGSTPTYGQAAQIIRSGVFMLIAGDANSDGQVNAVDVNLIWRLQNGQPFQYLLSTGDYNLDGTVNAVDLNLYWRPNNSKASQVPIEN